MRLFITSNFNGYREINDNQRKYSLKDASMLGQKNETGEKLY